MKLNEISQRRHEEIEDFIARDGKDIDIKLITSDHYLHFIWYNELPNM